VLVAPECLHAAYAAALADWPTRLVAYRDVCTGRLTSLLAIHGVGERAAFLRAIAWPSPEYRTARELGPLGLLGVGATRAKRG
jgi:hypothetical protein